MPSLGNNESPRSLTGAGLSAGPGRAELCSVCSFLPPLTLFCNEFPFKDVNDIFQSANEF